MADQWLLEKIKQQGASKTVPSPQAPVNSAVPTQPQADPNATPQGKIFTGNLVQKALDIPSVIRYGAAGFYKGAYGEKNKQMSQPGYNKSAMASPGDILNRFKAGVQAIPQGVQNRGAINAEPGNVDVAKEVGITNPIGKAAYNFGLEMALPDVPIGKITKATGINKLATNIVGKVKNVARNIEPVAKVIENVDPFFRNPELGKLVKAAEDRTQARLTKLSLMIERLTKGLTPAEQARIGQIMEGGVTTNKDYAKIAKELNDFSDEVGKQAVNLGLLDPDSYSQFKGQYMSHVWNEMITKGKDSELFVKNVVPNISGQFYKQRKGAEGYVKQFGPAVLKGLGTQIKDIEAGTLYKQIAEKYGKSAEKVIRTSEMGPMLVNELLKDGPKVRKGLGEVQKGFVSSEEIGPELLKVFKEYQPARTQVGEGIGMGVNGVMENVSGGVEKVKKTLNPAKAKLFAQTIWGDESAKRAYSYVMESMGYTPTQANLEIVLQKVGELPGIKPSKMKLGLEPLMRNTPLGYKYAPEAVTNSKTGKLLKDIALPPDVVDFINKKSQSSSKPGILEKSLDMWKKGKTIYNPAYHVRNKVSNQILSDFSTGEGLIGSTIGDIQSGRELAGKGNQMFAQVARNIGLIGRKSFGEMFDETLDTAGLQKTGKNILKKTDEALTGFQTKQEEAAKLNVFKSWITKYAQEAKKSVEEALTDPEIIRMAKDKAEEAIFSPYKISSNERNLVKKLSVPFYSFARQSIPFTTKTYLNNPSRITKYDKIKRGVEGLSPEDTEGDKNLPDYAKDTIRTPFKDKNGNNYRVDPQYILPYGNMGDTGFSQGRLPFGLSLNPLIMEGFQQMANKDLYFDQPITTSNQPGKATKQRIEHAARSLAPTLYSTIGYPASNVLPGGDVPASSGKLYGAVTGQKDYAGRTRSVPSAVLDAAGFKNSAIDVKEQTKFKQIDRNTARQGILKEIRDVRRDNRLSPQEKQKQVKDLLDQLKTL